MYICAALYAIQALFIKKNKIILAKLGNNKYSSQGTVF